MDQQFSLSWNNFHGNLTKGFAGLLGKGEFVDVTIAVEGHLLQAHKVILSICSPYFKKMFQMNPCQHPIVVLKDVTHKAMRDLLQFMYNGEVSVKREDLTSFIGTAEVLQIKGLTNKELDEEDNDKERETVKPSAETQMHTPEPEICTPETFDAGIDDITQNTEMELLKQRQFLEKLQRLSNLKRKSEEYLHKNYYSELLNSDKRAKIAERPIFMKQDNQIQSSYDNRNLYEETSINSSPNYNVNMQKAHKDNDKSKDQDNDNSIELKTECDDSDIIVTDPAVCSTPKNIDGHKDLSAPLDYQTHQDNCATLNSLFVDLKNLVNGKVPNAIIRAAEEFPRPPPEHRLVTIPQKEDGKKKYPQRSCRLCWKLGKRRDTRFMCIACELPFCKAPCFEIHFNDVIKLSHLQADYYAA